MAIDTKDLKDVLGLGVGVYKLINALSDGVGITDLGALLGAAKAVKPALEAVKSGRIIPELKDLDDTEKTEIKFWFHQQVASVPETEVEKVLEQVLSVTLDLCDLLKVF